MSGEAKLDERSSTLEVHETGVRHPSIRQKLTVMYRLLELAGRELPASSPGCSALIVELDAALEARRARAAGEDIPL